MRRRSNIIAVIVFLMVTLAVFLLSPRNRQRLQSGFLSVISPFLKKGSEVDAAWKSYQGKVKTLRELEDENAELRTRAARLEAENQALRSKEEENIRLNAALGYQKQSPFKLIPARVIGRPGANWWSAILLDRGSADGVEVDMCALTAEGLVGKVIQVSERVTTVLLVTDENCKVAARVEDSAEVHRQGIVGVDLRGEMRGDRVLDTTQPRLILKFVGRYESLNPGTKIFTSGAGQQVYPSGVLVGYVVDSKTRDLDKMAVIKPAVDLAGLTDVFIVAGMKDTHAQR